MTQFNLEEYLQNPTRKVVTRDGREVEIFCPTASGTTLLGKVSESEFYHYTKDGFQCDIMNQAKNDLFFADSEVCGDNRFEIISAAKKDLLESTNIDTDENEMKVIDRFLFRCWQMGWLDKYDKTKEI